MAEAASPIDVDHGLGQAARAAHTRRWSRRLPAVWSRSRTSLFVGICLAVVVLATLGILGLLWDTSPTAQDFSNKLAPPNWANPLGTDQFGRDQLARLLDGGRRSLGATAVTLLFTLVVGGGLGIVAGMAGGAIDAVVSRFIDVTLAIPGLVLALALVGVLGPGLRSIVVALIVSLWASYARLARALTFGIRRQGYVVAAEEIGRSRLAITVSHVVSQVLARLLVPAALDVGTVMIAIASLSFLGLGVQTPDAEWGVMLSESRLFLTAAPWLLLAPTIAIVVCVLAANLIGEGVDAALGRVVR